MDELFSPADLSRLHERFDVVWGQDAPIPGEVLADALPRADALIAATPRIDADTLAHAPRLRAIVEVSGAFPDTVDYAACFDCGVEVLSCAPGFRQGSA